MAHTNIGRAIRQVLEEEGVTKAELARRMGVPRSTITRITSPGYGGHAIGTLDRVAQALGRDLTITLVQKEGS